MLKNIPAKVVSTAFVLLMLVLPISAVVLFRAPLLWVFATAFLSLSCLFFALSNKTGRISKAAVVGSVVSLNLVNSAYLFSYFLQGEGFNARFFYHLRADLLLGGVAEFFGLLVTLVAILVASAVTILLCYRWHTQINSFYRYMAFAIACLGLIFYSPAKDTVTYLYAIYGATQESAQQRRFAENILKQPSISLNKNTKNKNIIILYLESVESSFYDSEYYPNLLPELSKIRDQSINFSGVKQVEAASWTIAGMFASLCSLPLHSPFSEGRNTLSLTNNFMSEALCLTDLLVDKGYVAHYVGGANTEFAGKKSFLKSHGFRSVKGLKELRHSLKNKKYKHGWGLYDDSTYNFAWTELEKLHRDELPFVLTMLTLDTHHPKGHKSESCKPYAGRESENSMLQALHCADQLASNFIRKLRSSKYSEDTAIVVVSDHLAMRNVMWNQIKDYKKERKISFFVNLPDAPPVNIDYPGTQYDIAPTILGATGIATISQSFPLGTSLTAGPGFMHQNSMDIDFGSTGLARDVTLTLWRNKFGNVKNGFILGRDGNLLKIKEEVISLKSDGWDGRAASLLTINASSGDIEDVKVWPHHAGLEEADLAQIIIDNPDKIYLAIAKYAYLRVFDSENSIEESKRKRVYFFGSSGSSGNILAAVPKKKWQKVDSTLISRKFRLAATQTDSAEKLKLRESYRQALLGEEGAALAVALEKFNTESGSLSSYEFQSCSFGSCDSYISINGKHESLERGLSIFGVLHSGGVRRLAYIDGCTAGAFDEKGGFKKLREKYEYFKTWVAVAHDTVGCHKAISRLNDWAENDVLTKLPSVEFREPYIALYDSESQRVVEVLGDGRKKIRLEKELSAVKMAELRSKKLLRLNDTESL